MGKRLAKNSSRKTRLLDIPLLVSLLSVFLVVGLTSGGGVFYKPSSWSKDSK